MPRSLCAVTTLLRPARTPLGGSDRCRTLGLRQARPGALEARRRSGGTSMLLDLADVFGARRRHHPIDLGRRSASVRSFTIAADVWYPTLTVSSCSGHPAPRSRLADAPFGFADASGARCLASLVLHLEGERGEATLSLDAAAATLHRAAPPRAPSGARARLTRAAWLQRQSPRMRVSQRTARPGTTWLTNHGDAVATRGQRERSLAGTCGCFKRLSLVPRCAAV